MAPYLHCGLGVGRWQSHRIAVSSVLRCVAVQRQVLLQHLKNDAYVRVRVCARVCVCVYDAHVRVCACVCIRLRRMYCTAHGCVCTFWHCCVAVQRQVLLQHLKNDAYVRVCMTRARVCVCVFASARVLIRVHSFA